MKPNPTKKQMKESADDWQKRKEHIKKREKRKRVAKAEREGSKGKY